MIDTDPKPLPIEQPKVRDACDVVVIGGGPAGATVAALVAEYGHSVLLLERSRVPRFHVGESLIPECYHTLERLGLVDELNARAFPKKYSVQFYSEGKQPSAPFYFHEYKDDPSSQTWQVERAVFDLLLLDCAREHGATVRSDARVLDVVFENGPDPAHRATGVRVAFDDGEQRQTREVAASVVVDATGQSAFLATRLGLKTADPHLKKGTIWSYFKSALRDDGRDEGATLILQTEGKQSWFWYIPLSDDVVSVGCTADMKDMFGPDRRSAAETFEAELARCPEMQRRLAPAERVADFLTTKDFSYTSKQAAGDGWLLVGDAFGFIDPVYSSGVFLALKSGEWAADAIHDALESGDVSASRLGAWQPAFREGVENFRGLVYAFYEPSFSFGGFLREHPEYSTNVVDILIGDVFKPGVGEIFKAIRLRNKSSEPLAS